MAQTGNNARSFRYLLWAGGLIVIIAIAVAVFMSRMTSTAGDADTSTTQLSASGLFRVTYTPAGGQVPLNQMHQWTLHVETADGVVVENALIQVNGDMPQHGHGLPTRPQVTEYLGNGDYLVEGLRFQMPGRWVMDISIEAGGQTDTVRFEMLLK